MARGYISLGLPTGFNQLASRADRIETDKAILKRIPVLRNFPKAPDTIGEPEEEPRSALQPCIHANPAGEQVEHYICRIARALPLWIPCGDSIG